MPVVTREQIPEQDTWRLEDIFESDAQWEEAFGQATKRIDELINWQGKLGQSALSLKAGLDAQAEASLAAERLYVYAHMRRDQDNGNGLYQRMADRSMTLMVKLGSTVSFFTPEILAIDTQTLQAWSEQDELNTYRHGLKDILRSKAHVLGHAEEKLLTMAGEVVAAPQTIYKFLDNADIRFPSVQTPDGEKEISHGSFIHLMQSADRALRSEVFTKFYQTYEGYRNTFAAALSSSIKGDIFEAQARKYPSALAASLHADNVPASVYDSLIEAVHQKFPAMYRYMDLRKEAMGWDELHMYDLYAPMNQAEFHVEYPQAQNIVLEGLRPLGADYGALLRQAFSERWLDVYENRGKTSGAYCWGSYGTHPYVLLNYQPNIDSVFTIAHEMGHAMHSYYSDKAQDYVNAQYKILVAEVASTVNEVLLMRYLLENESDKARKLRLLNYYLEQFRTTVYRQVMFAEFEKITHEMAERGEALTADVLEKVYLDLNKAYYGDAMRLDKGIGMEWARISHFYNAFYVYKYATGFSAAVALSKAILREGQPAVDRYLRFLSSGGSDYPLELLKAAGVDLEQPKPVIEALEVFEATLDELERLIQLER